MSVIIHPKPKPSQAKPNRNEHKIRSEIIMEMNLNYFDYIFAVLIENI